MDRTKWEYKKLGEVCEKLTDGSHNPPKGIEYSDYHMISSQNIFNDRIELTDFRCLSKEDFEAEDKRTALKKGDLLLTIVGAIGRCYVLDGTEGHITLQRSVAAITPKENILSRFLMYYFIGNNSKLNEEAHGVAQKGIYLKQLGNLIVPIPPMSDQQHIVAELDCLNDMIALKKEQLKEFDKLAQAIFYEMFGDDYDFEKVKLGDVVEVASGLVDPKSEPYCFQLHVSPANIVSGTNEIVNCVQAKDEGLISDKYPFKSGMVLYSKIRPNLNKVAMANFDGICSADMYPLNVLPKANNIYIMKLLSSKHFLEYAIKNSGRARMPKLNRETLFAYVFKLPPLPLQQQFAEKISAIEAQKELVRQSIAETQALLDYTMDKYFG